MWKTLDFNQKYKVSDQGEVVKIDTNYYLKQSKDKDGYLTCTLRNSDGTKTKYRVHRLIAMAFIPNPFNKPEVNHINSVRDDNRVLNLEWTTRSENQKHVFRNGRFPELREKAKENLLNYAVTANEQKVAQIDKKTGEILNTFKSMTEAERQTGINHRNISRACSKNGTAGGYKWIKI